MNLLGINQMNRSSKKSFVFYETYMDSLKQISDKKVQLELVMAILNYGLYQIEPKFSDDILRALFTSIKGPIDISIHNREVKSLNGSKGGAPIGNKNATKKDRNNLKQAKQPNVDVNVNTMQCNVMECSIYKDLPNELVVALKDFEDMRKKIKSPMTDRAKEMLVKKLEKLSNGNTNLMIEILNQSIIANYKDVYPLRENISSNKSSKGITIEDIQAMKGI